MNYLLGVDLGISSLKTVLLSEKGQILITSAVNYQYDSPCPGYAEQDPQVWLDACVRTVSSVLRQADISSSSVRAVSFSGQMNGLVMLDKDHRVIRPAILNCDARSVSQAERLNAFLPAETRRKLFRSPIRSGSVLTSLLWMRENEPDDFARIAHICSPKDYIRFRLTGVLSCEYSDAGASLLFDTETGRWSDEIIALTELPRGIFPDCTGSAAVVGHISPEASALTGLSESTLAAAGGGDLVMVSIGSGTVNNGDVLVYIGSGARVIFQSDHPVIDPDLNTSLFPAYSSGRWILCGETMNAGLCLKWWRNVTGNSAYDRIHEAVSGSRPGSGGILFYPYLTGERFPYRHPDISGCFLGLNASTGYGDMSRAVIEGVIYNLRQCAEICERLGFSPETFMASGGASRSDDWMQIMADIFNRPFCRVMGEDQPCLGAALTAGVGAGFWGSVPEAVSAVVRRQDRVFVPDPENAAVYEEYYQLFRDTFPLFKEKLRMLTNLGRKDRP